MQQCVGNGGSAVGWDGLGGVTAGLAEQRRQVGSPPACQEVLFSYCPVGQPVPLQLGIEEGNLGKLVARQEEKRRGRGKRINRWTKGQSRMSYSKAAARVGCGLFVSGGQSGYTTIRSSNRYISSTVGADADGRVDC